MPYIIDHGKVIPVNTEHDPKPVSYLLNDLNSVYTHFDPKLCKNVITPNELPTKNNLVNKGE